MQKTIISLVVIAAVVAGAWYFVSNRDGAQGEPVAVVNGENITASQLEDLQSQIAAEQGTTLEALDENTRAQVRTQALDVLISRTLLKQAAANAGVSVSAEDVAAQFDAIKGQFESDSAFQSTLTAEGLTEKTLRDQVKQDMTIQAYLRQELDLESITVTDEEIAQAYEAAIQGAEEVPPLEEVRDQVEQLVRGQKEQVLITQHVQELRENAEVEVLI